MSFVKAQFGVCLLGQHSLKMLADCFRFFLTFYDLFLPCESFSKHDDFVRGKIEDERFSIN